MSLRAVIWTVSARRGAYGAAAQCSNSTAGLALTLAIEDGWTPAAWVAGFETVLFTTEGIQDDNMRGRMCGCMARQSHMPSALRVRQYVNAVINYILH
jgi:hypothetical protein